MTQMKLSKRSKSGFFPVRFLASLILVCLFITLIQESAFAAEASPAEMKLRELVRNTMLQLRDAQAKIDTLTAAQAQSDREKGDLKKKIEELTRQGELDKKANEREREKAAIRIVMLDRLVTDHEEKNGELIKLANEVLTRYEKFGLGDALTAREPFVGLTRVKFQNLVQDYQDKVAEQRITHEKKSVLKIGVENHDSPPVKEEEKSDSKMEAKVETKATTSEIQDTLPTKEPSTNEPLAQAEVKSEKSEKPISKTNADENDPKEIIHEKK